MGLLLRPSFVSDRPSSIMTSSTNDMANVAARLGPLQFETLYQTHDEDGQ
jgi:hypothetical protein